MEVSYQWCGACLALDLGVGDSQTYGKYGMLRKSYLQEHGQGTYIRLLVQGKLSAYLAGIDRTARAQVEQAVEDGKVEAGVTDELKARDPMEWAGRMNSLKQQAEEAVYQDLIYR